jgi:hypothetical protein
MSLLDSIKSGNASLRKVPAQQQNVVHKAVAADPRQSMMQAIKMGSTTLRKVSKEEQEAAQLQRKSSGNGSGGGFGKRFML